MVCFHKGVDLERSSFVVVTIINTEEFDQSTPELMVSEMAFYGGEFFSFL